MKKGRRVKIYLAGTSVHSPQGKGKIASLFKKGHKLHSFFHVREKGFEKGWFEMNIKNKVCLFLDSGAYSAFTQGIEIDIYEYIDFIKKYEDILEVYANLDVIAKGKTEADKKQAAEKTLENQKIMEASGLSPLPTFHYGEPFEYLKYYTENYDYVALGGMVGTPSNKLILWLNVCFEKYICDKKGLPKVKIHGFGLTSLKLMMRYPWYSVDSTSWVMTGRTGGIYVPKFRNGKWIYNENSWKITISAANPGIQEAGKHFKTLSPGQQQVVLDYIHAKGYCLGKSQFKEEEQTYELKEGEKWAGKKPKDKASKRLIEIIEEPGLCNQYRLRDELNIVYYQDLEKALPEWPWAFKKRQAGFDL